MVSLIANDKRPEKPLFICVLGNTETAYIEKLSAAGKTAKLTDYTPTGDAELVETGGIISTPVIPMTPPYNTPTPGLITRASLQLSGVPHLFVNSGLKIPPKVPFEDMGARYGEDIRNDVAVHDVEGIIKAALSVGERVRDDHDMFVIGESIPAGTTTAMGVLDALGYDSNVSSSSSENPVELKRRVVKEAMDASGIISGGLKGDPMRAIACLGDPMMPAVAGLVSGLKGKRVILAGGTQMAAVYAFMKHMGTDLSNVSIVTTSYVANDETANFNEIIEALEADMFAIDPRFGNSSHKGLRQYELGYVKEGVGAGGALYLAGLLGVSVDTIREEIEKICLELADLINAE
ncbi:TIGR00303 family protein [Methanococcoides sp. SA1]|nr:TIGR00303 family protein [Methanococcoides sp. SA1]